MLCIFDAFFFNLSFTHVSCPVTGMMTGDKFCSLSLSLSLSLLSLSKMAPGPQTSQTPLCVAMHAGCVSVHHSETI